MMAGRVTYRAGSATSSRRMSSIKSELLRRWQEQQYHTCSSSTSSQDCSLSLEQFSGLDALGFTL